MGIAQLPLLTALTDKMRWHQAQQTLLAENVANAETPHYRARELKAYSFEDHLRNSAVAQVTTSTTAPQHFVVGSTDAGGVSGAQENAFEVTTSGAQGSLEEEMMKVTTNQMDYQAITTLYTRSLRLIRSALGNQA